MPCTILEATCPLLGLPSPAITAESNVKKAAPMQISRLVRTPAAVCFAWRSRPTSAPKKHASSSRPAAPLATSICSSQSKLSGCANWTRIVLMEISCPMLSLSRRLAGTPRIGDVNRARGLVGRNVMANNREPLRMRLYGLIDLIAVERDHNGRIRGRRRQRRPIEIAIAFVERLAQRNARERDEVGIDRGFHQHRRAGSRR